MVHSHLLRGQGFPVRHHLVFSCHPYHGHSGTWDEKLAEGDGANLVADRATSGLG
jgi:hypothetical protein